MPRTNESKLFARCKHKRKTCRRAGRTGVPRVLNPDGPMGHSIIPRFADGVDIRSVVVEAPTRPAGCGCDPDTTVAGVIHIQRKGTTFLTSQSGVYLQNLLRPRKHGCSSEK